MKKLVLLAVLLGAAFVLLYRLPVFQPPPPVAETQPAPAGQAPATEEQQAQAGPPVEEVRESPDTETTLERMIPRASVGHGLGLNKTPDPLGLRASAVLVFDAGSKQVLHAKNADAVLPIASITKLMTSMVVLDQQLPLNHAITITEDDVDRERSSRSRLRVGSVLSREDALRLALMSSENRAAHALARTSPQGMTAFIAAMNRKAKQLGMEKTQFVDPTGLSERNQSTASDLARLVMAASGYPVIRDFSTTEQHIQAVGGRRLQYRNSDPLVKEGTWDISLQKTGYIIEAGHSVVLRTKLAGKDVVMVILDADGNRTRTADAHRIRRWVDPEAEQRAVAAARAQREEAAKKQAADKKKQQVAEKKKQQVAEKKKPAQKKGGKEKGEKAVAKTKDTKAGAKQQHASDRKKQGES